MQEHLAVMSLQILFAMSSVVAISTRLVVYKLEWTSIFSRLHSTTVMFLKSSFQIFGIPRIELAVFPRQEHIRIVIHLPNLKGFNRVVKIIVASRLLNLQRKTRSRARLLYYMSLLWRNF